MCVCVFVFSKCFSVVTFCRTGGNLSLYLIALSAVLVALNMLQTDADDI